MVDRIKELCKKEGTNFKQLEIALGFANGSIAKSDEKIQAGRLYSIAKYFHVSMEYLLNGDDSDLISVNNPLLENIINSFYFMNDEGKKMLSDLADSLKLSGKHIKKVMTFPWRHNYE